MTFYNVKCINPTSKVSIIIKRFTALKCQSLLTRSSYKIKKSAYMLPNYDTEQPCSLKTTEEAGHSNKQWDPKHIQNIAQKEQILNHNVHHEGLPVESTGFQKT